MKYLFHCAMVSVLLVSSGVSHAVGGIDRMEAGGGGPGPDPALAAERAEAAADRAQINAEKAADRAARQEEDAANRAKQQEQLDNQRRIDNQKFHARAVERSDSILQNRLDQIQNNPNLSDVEKKDRSKILRERQHSCKSDINYCFK